MVSVALETVKVLVELFSSSKRSRYNKQAAEKTNPSSRCLCNLFSSATRAEENRTISLSNACGAPSFPDSEGSSRGAELLMNEGKLRDLRDLQLSVDEILELNLSAKRKKKERD